MLEKMGEIFNLSTLCRCCHSDGGDGSFKRLNFAYTVGDGVEIYELILQETLGLRILQPTMVTASYMICDTCIQTLQIAAEFRKQVIQCEEKFKVYCLNEQFVSEGLEDNSLKQVEVEIKNDPDNNDSDYNCFQDDEYWPDKTESHSPVPVKIKIEKATLEVDLSHPIEESIIKNERTEDFLKVEHLELETDEKAPIKKRPSIKNRSILKSKNKSANRKIRKKYPDKTLKTEYNKVMTTINSKDGIMYKCNSCEVTESNRKLLYDHIHYAHPNLFKCSHCEKAFKWTKYLQAHILKVHNTSKDHPCSQCPKKFRTLALKQDHEIQHLTKERKFECHICHKKLLHKATLVKHLKTHEESNKIYVCDQCGWSFHQRSNLEAHIRVVHLKVRPYNCTICKKSYTKKKSLKEHMDSHTQVNKVKSDKFKCERCDRTFSSLKCFKVHRLTHDDKFQCRYCSVICEGKAQHKAHVQYHILCQDRVHPCPLCGKVFMSTYSLNRHTDIIHGGNKRFICDFCGIKCSQKGLLLRHIRKKHSGVEEVSVEKMKCLICKRFFSDMAKHMISHDEDKKIYSCDICDNKYISNSVLNRHKSQKHYGVTFDCEVCGKKYVKKKSLSNHRFKMHTVKNEVVENNEVEVLIP